MMAKMGEEFLGLKRKTIERNRRMDMWFQEQDEKLLACDRKLDEIARQHEIER